VGRERAEHVAAPAQRRADRLSSTGRTGPIGKVPYFGATRAAP